ncbi:MAG TPA: hypothetical protein VIW22_08195 [Nitrososphaerales archaeon]
MFVSFVEEVVHSLGVSLSLAVLGIAVLAFVRQRSKRYLALLVAFLFLSADESVQFVESFYFNAFIYVPYLEIHLSHLLDLAMLISFGIALLVK